MSNKAFHTLIKIVFVIIGVLIIPLFSYYIGRRGDLLLVTFSQIAGRFQMISHLKVWGLVTGIYYFYFLNYIFCLINMDHKLIKGFIYAGCISIILSASLPFVPSLYPIVADIHNTLAYLGCVCSLVALVLFIVYLYKIDRKIFIESLVSFSVCVGSIALLYLFIGTCTLFQMLYPIGLSVFLLLLVIFIEKNKVFDFEQSINKYRNDKRWIFEN